MTRFTAPSGRAWLSSVLALALAVTIAPSSLGRTAIVRAAVGPLGARIAILSGTGTETNTVLAVFKALGDMGYSPQAIVKGDITNGKLTATNFDALLIPPGEEQNDLQYSSYLSLTDKKAIKSFTQAGGGLIGVAEGAKFINRIGIDTGTVHARSLDASPGMQNIVVGDATFGPPGTVYSVYVKDGARSFGGTHPMGTVVVSTFQTSSSNANQAVIRFPYGTGRVVMIAPDLELDVTSKRDWTAWDNLDTSGIDPQLDWPFLGSLVSWAVSGTASTPTINTAPQSGPVACIYTTRTSAEGAWAGVLPALARMLANNGYTPEAVRDVEVKNGFLTLANCPIFIMPGGYAYGYKVQLAGHEQKVRDYVSGGGRYVGISAGSFYAMSTVVWQGTTYAYPLNLFTGTETGPIDDIAPWPTWALTPLAMTDSALGTPTTLTAMFYGEGYYTQPAAPAPQADVSATFAYSGTAAGQPAILKFRYGLGKVFLPNLHLELMEGSLQDWTYWDNFDPSGNPISNPTPNADWSFYQTAFSWLMAP